MDYKSISHARLADGSMPGLGGRPARKRIASIAFYALGNAASRPAIAVFVSCARIAMGLWC